MKLEITQNIKSHWLEDAGYQMRTCAFMEDGKIVNVNVETRHYDECQPYGQGDEEGWVVKRHFGTMDEALAWVYTEAKKLVTECLERRATKGRMAGKQLEYFNEYKFHL
jgi:hypothetical protein